MPKIYDNPEGLADIVILTNHRDHKGVLKRMHNWDLNFSQIQEELKNFSGVELNTIEVKDFLIEVADMEISKKD